LAFSADFLLSGILWHKKSVLRLRVIGEIHLVNVGHSSLPKRSLTSTVRCFRVLPFFRRIKIYIMYKIRFPPMGLRLLRGVRGRGKEREGKGRGGKGREGEGPTHKYFGLDRRSVFRQSAHRPLWAFKASPTSSGLVADTPFHRPTHEASFTKQCNTVAVSGRCALRLGR